MTAIILSIIFPGLGHIYYGKNLKGIIMILLSLVPFLYPIILIWSIWDCINLRNTIVENPISKKEALKAIIVFLVIVPLFSIAFIWAGIFSLNYLSNNNWKPEHTKDEMVKIHFELEKYKSENNEYPKSLFEIIGSKPLKKTFLTDFWGTPYS